MSRNYNYPEKIQNNENFKFGNATESSISLDKYLNFQI